MIELASQAAQAAVAQFPILDLQIEHARLTWNYGHGPDIAEAAVESAKDMHPLEWPILAGFVALQGFELSPGNETWITNAGAKHFVESGGQDVIGSAWEVAQRSATLEFSLAIFAAWALHRMKPAVRMIYDSYLASPDEGDEATTIEEVPVEVEDEQEQEKEQEKDGRFKTKLKSIGKALGGVAAGYGLAMSTGTGGLETASDILNGGSKPARNLTRGFLGAAAITASNFMLAVGITSSIKYNIPGLKQVCDHLVDWLKTPVLAASIFGGLFAYQKHSQKKEILSRIQDQNDEIY